MWTLQDAKNKFSAVVNAALAGIPQEVTRRGKPVVVVISTSEYHQLLTEAQRARASFVDHLLGSVDDHFAAITPATRWIAAAKLSSVLS